MHRIVGVVATLILIAVAIMAPSVQPIAAQELTSLCSFDASRSVDSIDMSDGVRWCFDGEKLLLKSETTVVLRVAGGATPERTQHGFVPASDAMGRLDEYSDERILLPDHTVTVRIGDQEEAVRLTADLDASNDWLVRDFKAAWYGFVPGVGDSAQLVFAINAFIAEIEAIHADYQACIDDQAFWQRIGCGAGYSADLGFATGRVIVDGLPVINDLPKVKKALVGIRAALDTVEAYEKVDDLIAFLVPATLNVGAGTAPVALGTDEDPTPAEWAEMAERGYTTNTDHERCHGTETLGSTRQVIAPDFLNIRLTASGDRIMRLAPGAEVHTQTGFDYDLGRPNSVVEVNRTTWIRVHLPFEGQAEEPAQNGCGWVAARYLSSATDANLDVEIDRRQTEFAAGAGNRVTLEDFGRDSTLVVQALLDGDSVPFVGPRLTVDDTVRGFDGRAAAATSEDCFTLSEAVLCSVSVGGDYAEVTWQDGSVLSVIAA